MKNILYLTDNNIGVVGGVEESLKIIVNNLPDEFRASIFQPGKTSGNESLAINKNVKIIHCSNKKSLKKILRNPFVTLKYIFILWREIKFHNYNIIHTQSQGSLYLVSFLIKTKFLRKNFVLIHTERGLYSKYNNFIRTIFKLSLSHIDYFVCTTHFNLELWTQNIRNFSSLTRAMVIENTPGALYENDEVAEHCMSEDKNTIVVGFAGRYCGWKNWPLSIAIINELKKNTNIDLRVKAYIGCSDLRSKRSAEELFSRFESLVGKDYFDGKINASTADMERLYGSIDIFVLTSNPGTESFGRTVVEAMSKRCVVLATESGGPTEIIDNQSLICSDQHDFAIRIRDLACNPKMRQEIGIQNRLRVLKKYSLENNICKHIDLYKAASV